MTSLVKGLSVELATAMVVAVMFTYTFIGALGATFYVSYFNTSIIFTIMLVFLVKVYHSDDNRSPLGTQRLSSRSQVLGSGSYVTRKLRAVLPRLGNHASREAFFGALTVCRGTRVPFVKEIHKKSEPFPLWVVAVLSNEVENDKILSK